MRYSRCTVLLLVTLGLVLTLAPTAYAKDKEFFLYAGTYTGFKYISHGNPVSGSHNEGIYVSRFRPATGELTEPQLAARISNPSFLAISPDPVFFTRPVKIPFRWGRRAITSLM